MGTISLPDGERRLEVNREKNLQASWEALGGVNAWKKKSFGSKSTLSKIRREKTGRYPRGKGGQEDDLGSAPFFEERSLLQEKKKLKMAGVETSPLPGKRAARRFPESFQETMEGGGLFSRKVCRR